MVVMLDGGGEEFGISDIFGGNIIIVQKFKCSGCLIWF